MLGRTRPLREASCAPMANTTTVSNPNGLRRSGTYATFRQLRLQSRRGYIRQLTVSYRRQRGFHTRRIHGPQPTSRPQRRLMLQPKHALGTHWPIKANKPRASTTRSCLHRVQGQTAPHSAPNSQRASIQWTSSGTRTTESNRIHERSLHWTNANHGRRHVQGDHPALTPTPGSGCYSAGKSTGISTWFTQATGLS